MLLPLILAHLPLQVRKPNQLSDGMAYRWIRPILCASSNKEGTPEKNAPTAFADLPEACLKNPSCERARPESRRNRRKISGAVASEGIPASLRNQSLNQVLTGC